MVTQQFRRGKKYNKSKSIRGNSLSPKLREIRHDSALSQIIGDHTTSRRQAGFDVRLHIQASIHGFLC
jgi:hypothetical protein